MIRSAGGSAALAPGDALSTGGPIAQIGDAATASEAIVPATGQIGLHHVLGAMVPVPSDNDSPQRRQLRTEVQAMEQVAHDTRILLASEARDALQQQRSAIIMFFFIFMDNSTLESRRASQL